MERAYAVPKRPVPKKKAAMRPLFWGPIFSTKRPKSAADMPRNKMAREKVQVTSPIEAPKVSMMGRTRTLKA